MCVQLKQNHDTSCLSFFYPQHICPDARTAMGWCWTLVDSFPDHSHLHHVLNSNISIVHSVINGDCWPLASILPCSQKPRTFIQSLIGKCLLKAFMPHHWHTHTQNVRDGDRYDSAIKSTACSSRRVVLDSQNQHSGSHFPVTPVSGDLIASSHLCHFAKENPDYIHELTTFIY